MRSNEQVKQTPFTTSTGSQEGIAYYAWRWAREGPRKRERDCFKPLKISTRHCTYHNHMTGNFYARSLPRDGNKVGGQALLQ